MAKDIFGTDGVRGRANLFPMTVEMALGLGRALGKIFQRRGRKHRVVVGKDTRLSCYMFENALIAGLCSMGVDTLMLGPFPTPGVAFITRAYRADAGIVISASHNPFFDNGIKFFSSEGFKLPDEWEKEMEEIVRSQNFNDSLPEDHELGKNARVNDADGRYIEFVKATFPRQLSLRNMRIALDCANGAGYKVAPLVFKELDAEVFVTGNTPNGLNINKECGSTYPETIQRAVIEKDAHVGIALDGDADRVLMLDEEGQLVDGDTILAICARDLKQKGMLSKDKVVSTVMCNFGFLQAMEASGIDVIQAPVGDRYVVQEMLQHKANLGGEQSGHLIFLDHNTTGDGLVAALQVLKIMIETGSSLKELASFVKKCPQALVNVPVSSKPPLDGIKGVKDIVQKLQTELNGRGRILVRYSGTESLCRVMVEGDMLKEVQIMANQIAHAINDEIG